MEIKAQHPPVFEGMTIDTTKFTLSDLKVNLVRYSYGKPNINFLAIHDDEDTGVKAAFEYKSGLTKMYHYSLPVEKVYGKSGLSSGQLYLDDFSKVKKWKVSQNYPR